MSGARTIFVNSAWMVGAEVVMRVTSLAAVLYLSRTLTPDGVGIVEFGLAVFGVLHLVTMNGVEARLVPDMVRAPGEVTRLAGRSRFPELRHLLGPQLLGLAPGPLRRRRPGGVASDIEDEHQIVNVALAQVEGHLQKPVVSGPGRRGARPQSGDPAGAKRPHLPVQPRRLERLGAEPAPRPEPHRERRPTGHARVAPSRTLIRGIRSRHAIVNSRRRPGAGLRAALPGTG